VDLKAGDRVELKGKSRAGTVARRCFAPTKMVKKLGSCDAEAAH